MERRQKGEPGACAVGRSRGSRCCIMARHSAAASLGPGHAGGTAGRVGAQGSGSGVRAGAARPAALAVQNDRSVVRAWWNTRMPSREAPHIWQPWWMAGRPGRRHLLPESGFLQGEGRGSAVLPALPPVSSNPEGPSPEAETSAARQRLGGGDVGAATSSVTAVRARRRQSSVGSQPPPALAAQRGSRERRVIGVP